MRSLVLAFLLLVSVVSHALAERRVALVIGNRAYEHLPVLRNPVNDARAIAGLLGGQLGFEVIEVIDGDHSEMMAGIAAFGNAATDADIALVFFAGHGIQAGGRNYLLPVSVSIRTEIDLRTQAVRLDEIAEVMDVSGAKIKLIFLDACRDNPLPTLARGVTSLGLARQDTATIGTFFAFATAPNQIALDGIGGNSPFTEGLLSNLAEPGLEIRQVMGRVREYVVSSTDRRQVPWVNEALLGEVFLAKAAELKSDARSLDEDDIALCERIGANASRLMLESYIARYPDGFCAAAVRARLGTAPAPAATTAAAEPHEPPSDLNYEIASFWDHNGSKVALSAAGNSRVFYYEVPRAGMVAAGARKGTLLFKGRIEGRSYIGEAHVFSSNCGPMAYPVEGTVSADFTRIELTGRAPRRNSNCVNTGWRDDRLVFTYLSKAD